MLAKDKETFEYLDYEFWLPVVKKLLGDHLSKIESGNYLNFDKLIVDKFLTQFNYLRVFHGCRPENINLLVVQFLNNLVF